MHQPHQPPACPPRPPRPPPEQLSLLATSSSASNLPHSAGTKLHRSLILVDTVTTTHNYYPCYPPSSSPPPPPITTTYHHHHHHHRNITTYQDRSNTSSLPNHYSALFSLCLHRLDPRHGPSRAVMAAAAEAEQIEPAHKDRLFK